MVIMEGASHTKQSTDKSEESDQTVLDEIKQLEGLLESYATEDQSVLNDIKGLIVILQNPSIDNNARKDCLGYVAECLGCQKTYTDYDAAKWIHLDYLYYVDLLEELQNDDIKQILYRMTDKHLVKYVQDKSQILSDNPQGVMHCSMAESIQSIISFLRDEKHKPFQEVGAVKDLYVKTLKLITVCMKSTHDLGFSNEIFDRSVSSNLKPYIGLCCDIKYELDMNQGITTEELQAQRHQESLAFFTQYLEKPKKVITPSPIALLKDIDSLITTSNSTRLLYYLSPYVKKIIEKNISDENFAYVLSLYQHIASHNHEYINDDFWRVIQDNFISKFEEQVLFWARKYKKLEEGKDFLKSLKSIPNLDRQFTYWDNLINGLPKDEKNPFKGIGNLEEYIKQLSTLDKQARTDKIQADLTYTKVPDKLPIQETITEDEQVSDSQKKTTVSEKKPSVTVNEDTKYAREVGVILLGSCIGALCGIVTFCTCLKKVVGLQQLSETWQGVIGAAVSMACLLLGAGISKVCYNSLNPPSSSLQDPHAIEDKVPKRL